MKTQDTFKSETRKIINELAYQLTYGTQMQGYDTVYKDAAVVRLVTLHDKARKVKA